MPCRCVNGAPLNSLKTGSSLKTRQCSAAAAAAAAALLEDEFA